MIDNDSIEKQGWTFFYDMGHIQREVENITATIASRPIDKEGNSRPWLVMTQDREELFRRLVKDAMSIIRVWSQSLLSEEHHSADMARRDRLHIHCSLEIDKKYEVSCAEYDADGGKDHDEKMVMDEGHKIPPKVRIIDDLIRMWLIWYVVHGWFEMKAPDEAGNLLSKLSGIQSELKSALKTGKRCFTRPWRYW